MKKIILSLSLLFLYTNLTVFAQSQPQGNRSMFFDGIDDQIKCPAVNLNNFTIEFWIKTTQQGGNPAGWHTGFGLVDAEDNGGPNDYGTSLGAGKIVAGIGSTTQDYSLASNGVVNDGAWHHVAVTRAGNAIQIYIDGNLDNSGSATSVLVPVGNVPLTFGSLQTNLNYFNGQLDEIKIFNVVRTEPEIEADMLSSTPDGALGFWRFEEGTGSTAINSGSLGASHNGALQALPATPFWALRVTSVNDSGLGTLRQVIGDANTLPGINYIDFSIQQANPAIVSVITVSSAALPTISDAVIIDGYSAFGAVPNSAPFGSTNNAQIRIEVNAAVAVAGGSFGGITLENVNNSVIKGLSVYGVPSNGLSSRGISILGTSTDNSIEGCFIGVYANGTFNAASQNMNGIGINANNNTVGWNATPDVSKFNVIANSIFQGVTTGGDNNKVQGNYIGTTNNPLNSADNSGRGVVIAGSNSPVVNNIIGNSGDFGVLIAAGPHLNNKISQNHIFNNFAGGISLGSGANNNKQAPIITSATPTTITGTCTGCADGEIIEVFENPFPGNQGQIFKNATLVVGGTWSLSGTFTVGTHVTATITDSGNNTSTFSPPLLVVLGGGTNFITLGNTVWNNNTNWSADGISPCGCNPAGVSGANVIINNGHSASLSNGQLGPNNIISLQNAGSTLILEDDISSTTILQLDGQAGTRILSKELALPTVTTNNFAITSGTIVEYTFAGSGLIPTQFSGNNYRNLVISGSGAKQAGANMVISEDFTVASGDLFDTGSSFSIIVNGTTTINGIFQINGGNFTADGPVVINGTFNDNLTGGINTFNTTLTIGSGGTIATIGSNTTQYIFNGNILNQGTFSLINSSQWSINSDIFIENQSASVMRFAQGNSGLGTINGNVVVLDFPGGGDIEMYGNGGITIGAGRILTNQLGAYPATSRKLVVPKMNGTGTFINANNAVVAFADTGGGTASLDLTAPDNLWIYVFASNVIATNYYHINISNNGTNNLTGNTIINGILNIGPTATLNAGSSNINIKGDWNDMGIFVGGTGSVIFDGTVSPQSISAGVSTQFENININNTNHVILNSNVKSNSITFTQGHLILGPNTLTLTAVTATNQIIQTFNNASTSYIETNNIGRIARNNLAVGISYVFPVGDASSIRHIEITPDVADNFVVKFESPVIPTPSGVDIAAGSWSISGNLAKVNFLNSGSSSTATKIHFYTGSTWDNTGITTTVSLPNYSTTNSIDFTGGGERLTLFTPPSTAIVINPNTLENGTVDVAYTQSTLFSATGGTGPYTFTITSGSLPMGLALVTDQLVGNPTEAGTFNFTVTAEDATSNIGQKTYTIIISKAPQIVDAGSFMTIPLSENSYELFIITSSGLPAKYRSTNPQVASLSGSFLTIHTSRFNGEAEIQAFQDGDSNYNASDTVLVMKVNNFGITTSLQKDLENLAKVYPNPTTEKIWVEAVSQGLEVKEVGLLNEKGNPLSKQTIQNNQETIKIDLITMPSGVYFLKITTNQGIFVKKITKY